MNADGDDASAETLESPVRWGSMLKVSQRDWETRGGGNAIQRGL